MAKGYWIAHIDVSDPDAYKAYLGANAIRLAKYGARFLVRAGRNETKEGTLRSRHVVIEFEDYATALACYEFGGLSAPPGAARPGCAWRRRGRRGLRRAATALNREFEACDG